MAESRTTSDIAPTLADLKKLPMERQSRLLLVRLAQIYPSTRGAGGLSKHNLLMSGDPHQLALGYSHAEEYEVRRHLLGMPWTTLVNQGYIVDPVGNGFFYVTEEGLAVLNAFAARGTIESSAQIRTFADVLDLPNKEALFNDLTEQIVGALVSVMFIDVDNFKAVNDQHGHSEGDACLTEVARHINDAILGKGKLYRVGGDEFCVVLANFSSAEASATAERIRHDVDSLRPFGGTTKVSTSIGVATSDSSTTYDAESLYNLADKAMYVSKGTGKNRITTWPPSEEESSLADRNRKRATTAHGDQQERKRVVREQLAKFLKQGEQITNGIEYANTTSVQEKYDWKQRVERHLAENLDDSYVARFQSPKYHVSEFPSRMLASMRPHWAEVKSRMNMLNDFIVELRD